MNSVVSSRVFLPYIGFSGLPVSLLKLSLLLTLAGCAAIAPPAVENSVWSSLRGNLESLDDWQLSGRVNVRYYDEAYTPRIRWQQQDSRYAIRLWGTFNAGSTTIEGRPGFVTLQQDGNVLTASSPEDLILQQLGYELPVSHLEYWIKGLPAPGNEAELAFNELNQLSQLVQDGWTVTYPDPRQYDDLTLPRRVDMTRDNDQVRLRFVGLSWNLNPE